MPISAAEGIAVIGIVVPAVVIVTAYLVDAAGWKVDPRTIAVLVCAELLAGAAWLWRRQWLAPQFDAAELVGLGLVVGGVCAYTLWLARPDFLPVTVSPDAAHHQSLVDFIQERQRLVHDRGLRVYLAEMIDYPPGSHLLAALTAAWVGTVGLRVLHPILAAAVALKAGLIYLLILRLLPPARQRPALALAGTGFLLFAWSYTLNSFTGEFFYGHVTAETLVIALLWVLVRFWEAPEAVWLVVFVLVGMALAVTWTFWLPIPVVSLLLLLMWKRELAISLRALYFLGSVLPIAAIGLLYFRDQSGASVGLLHEGTVIQPSLELYGRPLLLLAAVGLAQSLREERARALALFSLVALAQSGLLLLSAEAHVTSFYLFYKMFFLLLYPLLLYAALGLGGTWQEIESRLASLWRPRWWRLAALLPVLVLVMAWRRDLPTQPPSIVTESLYEAGLWARANVPVGCVEYLVEHGTSAFWLHVAVLENVRASFRTEALLNELRPRALPLYWPDPARRAFAIVSDLRQAAPEVGAEANVLFRSGAAVVLEYRGEKRCEESTPPLDRVAAKARGATLAKALGPLLPFLPIQE